LSARSGTIAPLLALVAVGALVATLTPSPGGADTVQGLRAQAAELRSAEQAALLRLYAAESSLGRARDEVERLEARSQALAAEEMSARHRAEIVRRSLASSQGRLAQTVRSLYIDGDADPISVILGASSLDELVAGVESLSRAAEQNRRLIEQARSRTGELRVLRLQLGARRRALDGARAEARTAAGRLDAAVVSQTVVVSSLRRQGQLAAARIERLQEQARAAQRASEQIAARAVGTAAREQPAATPAVAQGTGSAPEPLPVAEGSAPGAERSLVVDAVAYHLPGKTASGLPVGVGVIAVDPNVIPLGTRVFVPGYGPAVAADVGSAIKGAIIDLWMPSTAQALAWGRRTVTITVYGS
jgi:cystine transport system substrate-binding protein